MTRLIKKAFTLIELLVVIAIVGILSGLIVVGMGSMTNQATVAKAEVFSNSLRNSLMMNMIGEWKFDSITGTVGSALTNGTVVADSWSTNNATTYGGPILKDTQDCVSGKCLSFDGSDDYVDCGASTQLAPTDAITIATWIKIKADYTPLSKHIFSKAGSYLMYSTASWIDRPQFFIYCEGVANGLAGTSPLQKDKWYYLVGTYEKVSKKMTLYIDGNYNSSTVITGCTDYSITTNSNHAVIANYSAFNGLIDDVRIYNAAMPTSQIREQYYAGLNGLLFGGGMTEEEYLERLARIDSLAQR